MKKKTVKKNKEKEKPFEFVISDDEDEPNAVAEGNLDHQENEYEKAKMKDFLNNILSGKQK